MAISGVIYASLIFFLAIILGILVILVNRRGLFKSMFDDTVDFLERKQDEYRLIAKTNFCGAVGTGYDSVACGDFDIEYTEYSEKESINLEAYDVDKINNQGSNKSNYDLTITNGTISVEEGRAQLNFSPTTTLVSSTFAEAIPSLYKSIYIEGVFESCTNIFTFGTNNITLTGNSTSCTGLTLTYNSNTITATDLNYTLGDVIKILIIWNEDEQTYNMVVNGKKLVTNSSISPYELITMNGFSISNITGSISDIRLSKDIISDYEAISITSDKYNLDYKMNDLNSPMLYKLIEYK